MKCIAWVRLLLAGKSYRDYCISLCSVKAISYLMISEMYTCADAFIIMRNSLNFEKPEKRNEAIILRESLNDCSAGIHS